QLLCSRQHRVTSGLTGLSGELEEKTLPSGESQPQQIQAVLTVSSDIWPDSAPTTLAHKAAPHRPRFEIFLLWSGVNPSSSSPARKPRGFGRTTWRLQEEDFWRRQLK
ncbi:hypothetical protein F2P79_009006, partial [Pimephales promelas]